MLLKIILSTLFILTSIEAFGHNSGSKMVITEMPKVLYKVVSVQDWDRSKSLGHVVLGPMDTDFVHLSTEDQLERIISKYWSSIPEYVVLKLDSTEFKGRLVLESNPGGETKYFHLYEGIIPISAVLKSKIYGNKLP